jgi:hypothetical protein
MSTTLDRAPVVAESVKNRTGIVEAPEAEPADTALDNLFKSQMGREPDTLDNTPDRERDNSGNREAPEPEYASELPEDDSSLESPARTDVVEPAATEEAAEDMDASAESAPTAEAKDATDSLEDLLLGRKSESPKPADDDPYKDIKLRSDASEKTRTTFEDLKRTAREREQKAREQAEQVRQEAEELRKKLKELEGKPASEEAERELKELREFRAVFETEKDPEFNKRFQSRRESNESVIFETLKKNGLKEDVIDKVRKLPYEQQVEQIARWADKLTAREKLTINSRLADNEAVDMERQQALAEARSKANEILAKGRTTGSPSDETFVAEVVSTLKPILPQVAFLHPKEIPASASPKERAEIEKSNSEAAAAQQRLLDLVQDTRPRTKALLSLSGILAPHYRAQALQAEARVAQLEREIASIRDAGRLSKTARGTGTVERSAPKVDIFETSADEALEQAWSAMQR